MRTSTQFSCREHEGVKCRTDVRDPVITYRVNSTVKRDSIFAEIRPYTYDHSWKTTGILITGEGDLNPNTYYSREDARAPRSLPFQIR